MSGPTREAYIAEINEGSFALLRNHQVALKSEPFAAEIWTLVEEKYPARFINMLAMGLFDPANIPHAKELILKAASDPKRDGLSQVFSWVYTDDLPYVDEIKSSIRDVMANPETRMDFLSHNMVDALRGLDGKEKFSHELFSSSATAAIAARFEISAENLSEKDVKQRKQDALQLVQRANYYHDSPDAERYHAIEKLAPAHLYEVISAGKAEVFTSTFKEFSKRLFESLPPPSDAPGQQGLSAIMVKSEYHRELMPAFLECCASYGVMDKVLAAQTPKQAEQMVTALIENVRTSNQSAQALTLLDIMDKNQHAGLQTMLLRELKTQINDESRTGSSLLKLVAAEYGNRHPDTAPEFCKELASLRKYHVAPTSKLDAKDLTDSQGRHHQAYLFYNDDDGRSSFAHMMRQYRDPQNLMRRIVAIFWKLLHARKVARKRNCTF